MRQQVLSRLTDEVNDPRYFQILFLSSFLLFGVSYLGWQSDALKYASILSATIVTQLIFTHFTTKRYHSVKSALITGLGLCLLLKTGSIQTALLAAVIAIGTKFILKVNNKHIFNPANSGIVLSILFTQDAWVSPGQWGSSILLLFLVGAAGLMMVFRVGRVDTSFAFLMTFGGLLFVRQVMYLGWEPSVWLHQMSNGTLLLFSFFMITDPMTTPNHPYARIIWAASLGLLLFILSNYFYMQTAAIWILFIISPFTYLFDRIFHAKKYEWNTQKSMPIRS